MMQDKRNIHTLLKTKRLVERNKPHRLKSNYNANFSNTYSKNATPHKLPHTSKSTNRPKEKKKRTPNSITITASKAWYSKSGEAPVPNTLTIFGVALGDIMLGDIDQLQYHKWVSSFSFTKFFFVLLYTCDIVVGQYY